MALRRVIRPEDLVLVDRPPRLVAPREDQLALKDPAFVDLRAAVKPLLWWEPGPPPEGWWGRWALVGTDIPEPVKQRFEQFAAGVTTPELHHLNQDHGWEVVMVPRAPRYDVYVRCLGPKERGRDGAVLAPPPARRGGRLVQERLHWALHKSRMREHPRQWLQLGVVSRAYVYQLQCNTISAAAGPFLYSSHPLVVAADGPFAAEARARAEAQAARGGRGAKLVLLVGCYAPALEPWNRGKPEFMAELAEYYAGGLLRTKGDTHVDAAAAAGPEPSEPSTE